MHANYIKHVSSVFQRKKRKCLCNKKYVQLYETVPVVSVPQQKFQAIDEKNDL